MLHKKAQISSTITWIVGFVIIFFITLVFFSLSFYLAAKKSSSALEMKEDIETLTLTKMLSSLLKTRLADCSFLQEFKEIEEKEGIRSRSYIEVSKDFLAGEPFGNIEERDLFFIPEQTIYYNNLNLKFRQKGDHDKYAKIFAYCFNNFFRDYNIAERKLVVAFPYGEMSFYPGIEGMPGESGYVYLPVVSGAGISKVAMSFNIKTPQGIVILEDLKNPFIFDKIKIKQEKNQQENGKSL